MLTWRLTIDCPVWYAMLSCKQVYETKPYHLNAHYTTTKAYKTV